jgi:hypothetical protein
MIKRTDATASWVLQDTSRSQYNQTASTLFVDTTGAEDTATTYAIDIVANGFKVRAPSTSTPLNSSAGTYVYAAFCENPFKYSLAR